MPSKNRVYKVSKIWCAQRVRPDAGEYNMGMFDSWEEAVAFVLAEPRPMIQRRNTFDGRFGI